MASKRAPPAKAHPGMAAHRKKLKVASPATPAGTWTGIKSKSEPGVQEAPLTHVHMQCHNHTRDMRV